MTVGKLFLMICAFLLLSGCATMEITSDYDSSVDFSALRSWGWMPKGEGESERTENVFVDARVRQAVERELKFKG